MPTISSDVATGRRMKVREGFTGCVPLPDRRLSSGVAFAVAREFHSHLAALLQLVGAGHHDHVAGIEAGSDFRGLSLADAGGDIADGYLESGFTR